MLIRGVIYHEVQNDADTLLLALGNHAVEVSERTVHRINILVVGDVVAEIHLRRWETWTDPNRVHAEIVQVGHLGGDALEIADAVIVAVGEAARIDLVEDSILPPLM